MILPSFVRHHCVADESERRRKEGGTSSHVIYNNSAIKIYITCSEVPPSSDDVRKRSLRNDVMFTSD